MPDTAVSLDELSKEELLEHAHAIGAHPANAGMTKEELRESIDAADKPEARSTQDDEEIVNEEYGAEAILENGPLPEPEAQEAPELLADPADEYGAEARYWAGEYSEDGTPPTEPPGGWPGEETTPAAVTDVSPATIGVGPPADETLTITGTNFTEASVVTFNDVGVAASFVSDTSLTTIIATGSQPVATVISVAVDGSAPFAVTVA